MTPGPDPDLVRGWLAARSLARGLPAPVADHGGWRVDTGIEAERQRYVFASATPGLAHLAATIDAPAIFLKLCADAATFRALLPPRWTITDANRMMVTDGAPPPPGRCPPAISPPPRTPPASPMSRSPAPPAISPRAAMPPNWTASSSTTASSPPNPTAAVASATR